MTSARPAISVRFGAVRSGAFALALAGAGAICADSARAQSLTDALVLAYQNNPNILSQRAQLRS